jgi:pantothenate kinase
MTDYLKPGAASAPPTITASVAELVERARQLMATRPRTVLGITGTPGSGKSSVSSAIVSALGPAAAAVEMDGFHLDDTVLRRLGRLERKGAPDTFDVEGYLAQLHRARTQRAGVVYALRFDRGLEASIAGAVPIEVRQRLIVTAGNYLVLARPGWQRVRELLDEVWFVDVDPSVRRERLVNRRVAFGEAYDDALDWVRGVDEVNADLIEHGRAAADVVITIVDSPVAMSETDFEAKGQGDVLCTHS